MPTTPVISASPAGPVARKPCTTAAMINATPHCRPLAIRFLRLKNFMPARQHKIAVGGQSIAVIQRRDPAAISAREAGIQRFFLPAPPSPRPSPGGRGGGGDRGISLPPRQRGGRSVSLSLWERDKGRGKINRPSVSGFDMTTVSFPFLRRPLPGPHPEGEGEEATGHFPVPLAKRWPERLPLPLGEGSRERENQPPPPLANLTWQQTLRKDGQSAASRNRREAVGLRAWRDRHPPSGNQPAAASNSRCAAAIRAHCRRASCAARSSPRAAHTSAYFCQLT